MSSLTLPLPVRASSSPEKDSVSVTAMLPLLVLAWIDSPATAVRRTLPLLVVALISLPRTPCRARLPLEASARVFPTMSVSLMLPLPVFTVSPPRTRSARTLPDPVLASTSPSMS